MYLPPFPGVGEVEKVKNREVTGRGWRKDLLGSAGFDWRPEVLLRREARAAQRGGKDGDIDENKNTNVLKKLKTKGDEKEKRGDRRRVEGRRLREPVVFPARLQLICTWPPPIHYFCHCYFDKSSLHLEHHHLVLTMVNRYDSRPIRRVCPFTAQLDGSGNVILVNALVYHARSYSPCPFST